MADIQNIGDVADIQDDMSILEDETPAPDPIEDDDDDIPDDDTDDNDEDDDAPEPAPKPAKAPAPPEPEEEDADDEEGKEKPPAEDTHPLGGRRLSVKQIEAKFPKLFDPKEGFPELKDSFFRDSKFRRSFSTPEEAAEAVESLEVYDKLAETLDQGDPSLLLSTLRQRGKLKDVAGKLLPALSQINPALVVAAVKPNFVALLRNARKEAERSGNKNLLHSVAHIAQFAELDLEEKPPEAGKPNPELTKLQQENQRLAAREQQRFFTTVANTGTSQLKREVAVHLNKVKEFSPIERRTLIDKIVDEIGTRLDADDVHSRTMDKLVERAERAGLREEDIPRIASAYLGGARPLIGTVLKKHVASAMKEKGIKPGNAPGSGVLKDVHGAGGGTPKGDALPSAKDVDFSKASDEEILSGKPIPLRKKG